MLDLISRVSDTSRLGKCCISLWGTHNRGWQQIRQGRQTDMLIYEPRGGVSLVSHPRTWRRVCGNGQALSRQGVGIALHGCDTHIHTRVTNKREPSNLIAHFETTQAGSLKAKGCLARGKDTDRQRPPDELGHLGWPFP